MRISMNKTLYEGSIKRTEDFRKEQETLSERNSGKKETLAADKEAVVVTISEEGRAYQAEEAEEEAKEQEMEVAEETETTEMGGSVAVNVGKRMRQIAAAKTPEQLEAVIALLQEDLKDCKEGLANGMCDQAEVDKVKALLQRANARRSEVSGDTETTPADEMAFAIASLM